MNQKKAKLLRKSVYGPDGSTRVREHFYNKKDPHKRVFCDKKRIEYKLSKRAYTALSAPEKAKINA